MAPLPAAWRYSSEHSTENTTTVQLCPMPHDAHKAKKKKDYIKHNQVHPAHTCTSDSGLCACSQGHEEATHYLSLSVKEEEVLRNVCRLSSKARERGSARERGGAPPRERGAGCWEQLRS